MLIDELNPLDKIEETKIIEEIKRNLNQFDLKDLNVDLVDAFIRLLPNYIFDIHRFFIYNNIFNFTIFNKYCFIPHIF